MDLLLKRFPEQLNEDLAIRAIREKKTKKVLVVEILQKFLSQKGEKR